jgi:hypothetical protein
MATATIAVAARFRPLRPLYNLVLPPSISPFEHIVWLPDQLSVTLLLTGGIMTSGTVDKEVQNGGVDVVMSVDADFIDHSKCFATAKGGPTS